MNIAVIGTGYVGLVSGVCLAFKGHTVTCFDSNESTIAVLQNGDTHIHENGLQDLMLKSRDNISFRLLDSKNEFSLLEFEAIIVAVGTPTVNGKIDLRQIESVAMMMGRLLKDSEKYVSIILKSTVLPGTTDTFFKNILEIGSGKKLGQFGIGMNPEFLREGNAVDDFLEPDRIVLGYEDEKTLGILREIYLPWSCSKVELNSRSAEMMKYVNNTLLATLISSVNEYANISREIGGIDFDQVIRGVHLDNRWSPLMDDGNKVFPQILDYLRPGCGYGGSCFPKDVKALSSLAREVLIDPKIIDSVIAVNENQPIQIIKILEDKVKDLSGKRILILGLAFKPETDDVRESVSLKLLSALANKCLKLSAHDPIAIENAKRHINPSIDVNFIDDWEKGVDEADIIIVATNWRAYKAIDDVACTLAGKLIFDTRALLDPNLYNHQDYLSIN